jgi:hypothetical protein
VLIDAPFAREGVPVLQLIATTATPWPGPLAVLRGGTPAGLVAHATVERPALMGRTLGPFPPGPLWRWDTGAALEVEVAGGALQSIGDAAALAFGNLLALQGPDGDWEVVSAARADLVGPSRYRLSRFLRGLGQTERAAARALPAGALVVALDEAVIPVATGLDELGRLWTHRVVPPGLDAGDALAATLSAPVGPAALRPLAPVHVRARRGPAGIAVTWVRRTRIGGDNWDLAEVPLGEDAERYRIDVLDGATLRRSAETTTPGWLYPLADELADFAVPRPDLALRVAQISAAVGPGTPLEGLVAVR